MAVIKIKASSTNRAKDMKDYLEKNDRAEEKTAWNCNPKDWDKDMENTKEYYDKTDKRQYYQIIQAFDKEPENPNYNPDEVHQAGNELAKEFYEKGYEVVVITHNDTDNLHNHIVINSVNAETGEKLHLSKNDIEDIHEKCNEICKEHGLRTLDESKEIKDQREREQGIQPESRKTDEKWIAERGQSYKENMRNNLQEIFQREDIKTEEEYRQALEEKGMKISRETQKTLTYEDENGNKARANKLGDFNRENINNLYERNKELEQEKQLEQEQQQEKEFERDRDREEKNSRDHSRSNSNYDRGGYER